MIGYVICLIDIGKADVIKELCEYYKNLTEAFTLDKERENNWTKVIEDIIEIINEKLTLTVEEFIADKLTLPKEQRLPDSDYNWENIVRALQIFPGLTLREILNNLRKLPSKMRLDRDLHRIETERIIQRKREDRELTEYASKHKLSGLTYTKPCLPSLVAKSKCAQRYQDLNPLFESTNGIWRLSDFIEESLLNNMLGIFKHYMERNGFTKIQYITARFQHDICPRWPDPILGSNIDDKLFVMALTAYIRSTFTEQPIDNPSVDIRTRRFYLDQSS